MIIQLTLSLGIFLVIHSLLRHAKRIALIPLYGLLIIRLMYIAPIRSSVSIWPQSLINHASLPISLVILWVSGSLFVAFLSLFHYLQIRNLSNHGIVRSSTSQPSLIGFLKPTIFLPPTPTSDDDLILLHEQTHHKRGHNWLKAIMLIACAAYWWHPLIWIVRTRLNQDLELDCDEAMLKLIEPEDRKRYAHCIVRHASHISPIVSSLGGSPMKKRIRRILQPKSQPVVVSLLIMTVVFFLAIPFLSSPVLGVSPHIVKSNVSGLQLRQAAAHIPQLSEKGIDPLEVEKLQVKVQMIYEDRVALAKLHMKISEYLSTSKNSSMVEELKRQLEESKDDILELNSLIEKYDL